MVEMTPSDWIPVNRPRRYQCTQQRVFRHIFEVPPIAGVTGQVYPAGQLHVEPTAAGLAAHHGSRQAGQGRVETGPQRDTRRERRRRITRPVPGVGNSQAGIAHQQGGQAEAWHTRYVTGAHRHSLRDAWISFGDHVVRAHDADQQRETLFVGHLRLGLARFHVGRRFRHVSWSGWHGHGHALRSSRPAKRVPRDDLRARG